MSKKKTTKKAKKKASPTSRVKKVKAEKGSSKAKKVTPSRRRGRIPIYGAVWRRADKLAVGRSISVKMPASDDWDLSAFRNALAMSLGRHFGPGFFGTSIDKAKNAVIIIRKG